MDFHTAICRDRTTKYAGVLAGAPTYFAEFFPAVEDLAERHGLTVEPDTLASLGCAADGDSGLKPCQKLAVHAALQWLADAEEEKGGTVAAVFGRERAMVGGWRPW